MGVFNVEKLISEARRLAAEYRRTTGKPLGISAEIAEFDAARLLNLQLCEQKNSGYSALGAGLREGKRIQIKGRAIFDEHKGGQRVGQLKFDQPWDSVVLVLMNEDFEAMAIYEAERDVIEQAMQDKPSTRSKRGAMSVARFKNIGRLVWHREQGGVEV